MHKHQTLALVLSLLLAAGCTGAAKRSTTTPQASAPVEAKSQASTQPATARDTQFGARQWATAEPGKGVAHALLVGVSQYQQQGLKLDFAHKDAEELGKFLQETQQGLFQNVYLRINDMATLSYIRDVFDSLKTKMQPDDTFYFFFSGHGALDETGKYYLLLHDCQPTGSQGKLWIARHEKYPQATALNELLATLPCHTVVTIFDACHATGGRDEKSEKDALKAEGELQLSAKRSQGTGTQIKARVSFCACRRSEVALEDDDSKQGYFTAALLEGLTGGADENGDRAVSLNEIGRYLEEKVPQKSRSQHPFFDADVAKQEVLDNIHMAKGVGSPIVRVAGELGRVMVFIPARAQASGALEDAFWLGNDINENESFQDEQPAVEIKLRPYFMDQYEVTNQSYCAFLNQPEVAKSLAEDSGFVTCDGKNYLSLKHTRIVRQGNQFTVQDGYDQHPVTGVTWYGANAYCDWATQALATQEKFAVVSRETGKAQTITEYLSRAEILGKLGATRLRKTLPTEAQWEKAGRGGVIWDGLRDNPFPRRKYSWLWNPTIKASEVAAHFTKDPLFPKKDTAPVGSCALDKATLHSDSLYGISDMAGNAWEWTRDVYVPDYYLRLTNADTIDKRTEPQAEYFLKAGLEKIEEMGRVARGGSFSDLARMIRVTNRYRLFPNKGYHNVGFRCAVVGE